jgi:UDP-N-acetylglucosamine--N-acetylmuramyl-(pentapeptide) pyrophosphoryl-undecaprenol N-acetylglucosamine transferase
MSPSARVYVFAGGGTGGHIFPALAIAERLRARGPARCLFLCSDRPLDAQILSREREHFRVIAAKPFGVRPRALVRFITSWGPSVREARRALAERRRSGEDVRMVAMGGFVAAPCVQAARAERVPVLLVNMDAVPGKANRWVARHAARIITSTTVPGETWPQVPPIVRSAATAAGDPGRCRAALGLVPSKTTLLVTGASQGARSINSMLAELARREPAAFRGWQVIHQTGAGEDEAVQTAYEAAGIPALVRPFFDAMGQAWGAADLAVSRAGAGSVAEAWANRVPTVFLPYPYHKDQHQRFNAAPLVDAGGAVLADDLIDPARNIGGAGKALLELMASAERRAALRAALTRLGPADGADRIAAALSEP